jgi:prepilin-type N-terminal cleavage/methylation domain-containing protein
MDSRGEVMVRRSRGFTLLETLIALSLVSVSMTGLVVAVGSSSTFGALARRQATAMTVARSQAEALSHAPYGDLSINNGNVSNDVDLSFADPAGKFASGTTPTGSDAPDVKLFSLETGALKPPVLVGSEPYDVFVNVRPIADATNAGVEQGKQIAVIVRYKVGAHWMRAVAIAYRYNPAAVGVADSLPL